MRLDETTVVVTGGTGFLGRHVAAQLAHAGCGVVAPGRNDYDLLERGQVRRLLSDHRPDAVVHLAATVGGIGANRSEPGRFFFENAMMGIQLLEECRLARVPKALVAGTVCSYPKLTPVPFAEADLWHGYPEETNAPYAVAKKMLLAQAQAYRAQYSSNFVYVLLTNLYGPGDNFDLAFGHVIPSIIRRFLVARDHGDPEVVLWGDGTPTREFLHVRDAARAVRLALEYYDGADPVNIGAGREISIAGLAELLAGIVGYRGRLRWDNSRPNGQQRRRLDVVRAAELFGFEAEIPLREGLRETVEWYEQSAVHTR